MIAPMRAISVTVGRDRGPRSPIAPLQPLPAELWDALQAGILAALERIPGQETERRQGHTVWQGRREQCVTFSRLWSAPTDNQLAALRATLADLAGRYDQDALVLHVEERHLVCPIGVR